MHSNNLIAKSGSQKPIICALPDLLHHIHSQLKTLHILIIESEKYSELFPPLHSKAVHLTS